MNAAPSETNPFDDAVAKMLERARGRGAILPDREYAKYGTEVVPDRSEPGTRSDPSPRHLADKGSTATGFCAKKGAFKASPFYSELSHGFYIVTLSASCGWCTVALRMSTRRAAFTLLEMCLSLAIGMVLILLGVPSVVGVLAEQRLHASYTRFEELASAAHARSVQEQKPYRLLWDKHGIVLQALARPDAKSSSASEDGGRLEVAEGESYQVERIAALVHPAPAEWTFWPDGTCEPVIVSYRGRAGQWRVQFDALSPHGTFLNSETL